MFRLIQDTSTHVIVGMLTAQGCKCLTLGEDTCWLSERMNAWINEGVNGRQNERVND